MKGKANVKNGRSRWLVTRHGNNKSQITRPKERGTFHIKSVITIHHKWYTLGGGSKRRKLEFLENKRLRFYIILLNFLFKIYFPLFQVNFCWYKIIPSFIDTTVVIARRSRIILDPRLDTAATYKKFIFCNI